MTDSFNNSTNLNKLINPFLKDISFNNPFLDSSGSFFVNPLFNPFLGCKEKNKILLLTNEKEEKDKNKHNKKPLSNFNMRLDNILDNIVKEREKNTLNSNLFHIKNDLNKKMLLEDKPLTVKKTDKKQSMDDLISQITKKYDLAHKENNSILPKPKKRAPPPPPPLRLRNRSKPPGFYNKRSSIFNAFDNSRPPLPPPPPPIKRELKIIDREINGLQDLLKLIEDFPMSPTIEYNINMQSIHNIKEPLNELNNMIGMNGLKDSVVDQIVYFVQNLHINKNALNPDFMHTCIYGPPGTGKTEIAKIMGKIFSSLGVLKKKYFKKVTRADLIAGYLGQTAMKTRDVIKDALGGVLFIDEAYALGNPEKRDSFAKECIDTLCEALSDNKDKLMVIIAGYEEDLKKCFFAYNQGLNSRFPWRFKTDDYKAPELNKIFQKKVKDAGWSLKEGLKNSWFEDKMDSFPFYGRDMETLLAKIKIAHGRRVFCKPKDEKTKLIMKDIEKGYKMFAENDEKEDSIKDILSHMYL